MNKQQLANKIWESANKMRSKIEANEYKDYILGFIFYKFLSDKEVELLKKDGYGKYNYSFKANRQVEEIKDSGEIILHSNIREAAKLINDKNAEKSDAVTFL